MNNTVKIYTTDELDAKTLIAIRYIAGEELKLTGLTKASRSVVVAAILRKQDEIVPRTTVAPSTVGIGNPTNIMVTVISGAERQTFPVHGKNVSEAASMLNQLMNIDTTNYEAVVNGEKVDKTYVLKGGDVVNYVKPADKKG